MERMKTTFPWILCVVLAAALLLMARKQAAKEDSLKDEEATNAILRMKGEAYDALINGRTEEALERFELLAAHTQDSTFLPPIKEWIALHDGRWMEGLSTEDLHARLREAEERLIRYNDQGSDLQLRDRQMDELEQVDGSHLERDLEEILKELEEARMELSKRRARGILRFHSAKKGEDVIYLGEIENGKAHGHGVGVWRSGSVYEGQWYNGTRHGKGEFTWPDGERYVGDHVADMRTGLGTYHWKNGQRWEGHWLNDMRHGEGTLYETDGRLRVKGTWNKDKLVRSK